MTAETPALATPAKGDGRRRLIAFDHLAPRVRGAAATAAAARLLRSHRAHVIVALALLAVGLAPVFQGNLTRPGDDYFFHNWDRHSQALVLGKIEQDAKGAGSTPFGLVGTAPDSETAYTDLDALDAGSATSATAYGAYMSSVGAQGYLFEGLHSLGCTSLTCLNAAESSLFSVVFVLFGAALALVTRRSFAVVFLVTGVLSPWVVSSAHNLYWVTWTWLLPAVAAAFACVARTRRGRIIGIAAVGVAVLLKSSTGYEFLTTVTLLAAGMPILAKLFGRITLWRRALSEAAWVFGACVAGFLVALVVHALVVGGGDLGSGLGWIIHDAERRTWGSGSDPDPLVTASLHASVGTVLVRYLFGWSSFIVALGIGPFPFALASQGFWLLVLVPSVIAGVLLLRGDPRGRLYTLVLLVTVLPALSWLVLAKSHAFAETNETYLLWYLPFIPALIWVLVDAAAHLPVVLAARRLGAPSGGLRLAPSPVEDGRPRG